MVLLDMGVEGHNLYTADVTRTLPIDGTYTPLQRELYDLVLAAQDAGIAAVRPGVPFHAAHDAAMDVLAHGLESLGLLPCSAEEALDPGSKVYARWTLHGVSHMLGMDVHDCGQASPESYAKGTLAESMVLTVEPGLYFQADDLLVPEEMRGIGIRIEDDILVTADGAKNLSASLPRSSSGVEEWLAAGKG
jgi:Xaa-Pro aminopeptidase